MSEEKNTVQSTETVMTPEEIKLFREEMARKRIEKEREALLKEMLEKDENRDVYSELYNNWGLKEMVQRDPSLLDSKSLFIRAAGLCKKEREMAMKLSEKEETSKKNEAKETTVPPEEPTAVKPPEKKEMNIASMDVFSREYLDSLPKDSARRIFFEMNKPKQQPIGR